MKHKWETRVRRYVHAIDGASTFYVEKRKWYWGIIPLDGWQYVSTSYATSLGKAKMLAREALASLTKHASYHGEVLWTSHNREVER